MITTDILINCTKPPALRTILGYVREGVTQVRRVNFIISSNKQYRSRYVTVGVLFRITHFNHGMMVDPGGIQNRMKKKNKEYDRIFMFGDLDGGTFCIIYNAEQSSREVVKFSMDDVAIGQTYVLMGLFSENGSHLRQDMPVLLCDKHFIPLTTAIVPYLPRIPMYPPSDGQETTFFIQHGKFVNLQDVALVGKGDMYAPTCPGIFCDRMNIFEKHTQTCGCFTSNGTANRSSIVIECDMTWTGGTAPTHIVKNRSYRTTQLFLDNPEFYETMSEQQRAVFNHTFVDAVLTAADYINQHGGFTIMGTCSRGEIHDASNKSETIAAVNLTWAVCYFQPTDLSILENEDYVALKFHYELSQTQDEDDQPQPQGVVYAAAHNPVNPQAQPAAHLVARNSTCQATANQVVTTAQVQTTAHGNTKKSTSQAEANQVVDTRKKSPRHVQQT